VDDVTIYQASYQPTGKLFLMINGQPKTLTVNTTFQDRGVSLFPLSGDKALVVFPFFVNQDQIPTNKIVAFIKTPNGFLGQEPGKMPENLRLEQGETGTLDGMTIQFVRPEIATGLQIKKAPEVSLMYLAYLIVMIGAVMCIFSQRQIWTAVTQGPDGQGERIDFLFKTNRAKLSFLKELEQIEARLEQRLNHKTVSKETAS
jgi:cytochrome c biogenesis protein ResB